MRAALARGDLAEVGRLGHALKGTVVYLGAHGASEAALGVERFAISSDGTAREAQTAVEAFERECLTLKAALREHPLASEVAGGSQAVMEVVSGIEACRVIGDAADLGGIQTISG
jgi:hypothetical protein